LFKGGAGRIYKEGELVYSDSGLVARKGKQLLVSGFMDLGAQTQLRESGFRVKKNLCRYQQAVVSPWIFLVFRLFLFFFGPFSWSSRFVRSYLQKKMIVGSQPVESFMERTVEITGKGIEIKSKIEKGSQYTEAYRSAHFVPIYVAVSECFDRSQFKTSVKKMTRDKGGFYLHEIIQ